MCITHAVPLVKQKKWAISGDFLSPSLFHFIRNIILNHIKYHTQYTLAGIHNINITYFLNINLGDTLFGFIAKKLNKWGYIDNLLVRQDSRPI